MKAIKPHAWTASAVLLLFGAAMLVSTSAADAQWERNRGWGGRRCPGGDCYYRRTPQRPPWAGDRGVGRGKICYNFLGKPYIYRGGGRCPIS